jgi:RNA polymerase sigma-70 factor (ECF subfamily)
MIEEQYLIRQIKSGSQKALETVIDRYGSYVKAIAANIIKPPMTDADIEEVVSDVFLSLWSHPGDPDRGSLKGYLAAITRNKARDRLRRFHIEVPLESDCLEVPVEDSCRQIELAQLKEAVKQVVDRLEEPDRTILLRYYYFYQKTDAIARDMGMNPATVRTKLARSRQKLKEWLTQEFSDDVRERSSYEDTGI